MENLNIRLNVFPLKKKKKLTFPKQIGRDLVEIDEFPNGDPERKFFREF